jgi:HIRAN domain.
VRVDWRGRKLGYVPRSQNAAVAWMLDRGERLSARIVALRESRDPWQRIRFEVML